MHTHIIFQSQYIMSTANTCKLEDVDVIHEGSRTVRSYFLFSGTICKCESIFILYSRFRSNGILSTYAFPDDLMSFHIGYACVCTWVVYTRIRKSDTLLENDNATYRPFESRIVNKNVTIITETPHILKLCCISKTICNSYFKLFSSFFS